MASSFSYSLRTWFVVFAAGSACASPMAAEEIAQREQLQSAADNEAESLLLQVLDSLWGIPDGHVEYTTEGPTGTLKKWKAWFKGRDRLRVEVDRPSRKSLRVADELASWAIISGVKTTQPTLRKLDDKIRDVFDIRVLGLDTLPPSDLGGRFWEDMVAELDVQFKMQSIEDADVDGCLVKLISTEFATGFRKRVWIDLERGPSVVKVETEGIGGKKHILDRTVSHLKNYGGTWFPERVVWTRYLDHNKHGVSEFASVDLAEFNIGLKDDLFTLGAIGVPAGTPVADLPEHPDGQRLWDGQDIVTTVANVAADEAARDARIVRQFPPPASFAWQRVLIGVNLFLGLGCILFYFRQKN